MEAVSLIWGLLGALIGFLRKLIPAFISLASHFSVFKGRKQPKGLPHIDIVEYVSKRCIRVLGMNPGPHTLQGTNTYLVGSGAVKALVDTGEGSTADEWLINLMSVMAATKTTRLSHVFLTHGHHDHQGGVAKLMKELTSRDMLPLPVVYKRLMEGGGDFPPRGFSQYGCQHLEDEQVFQIPGGGGGGGNTTTRNTTTTTLHALYTPGHTDDSVCFVLREDMALLSGDSVLGCGSSVFDDLTSYMASLHRMRSHMLCAETNGSSGSGSGSGGGGGGGSGKKGGIRGRPLVLHTIYPGHGGIVINDGIKKIDEYIQHRQDREETILTVLKQHHMRKGGLGEGGSSSASLLSGLEIVERVYRDMKLNVVLKISAHASVHHHLGKLQGEGKVQSVWPDLWRVCV
jgi:glyoxylase-like metal-dependent hydrolase (beta-lactamase superfamily II)